MDIHRSMDVRPWTVHSIDDHPYRTLITHKQRLVLCSVMTPAQPSVDIFLYRNDPSAFVGTIEEWSSVRTQKRHACCDPYKYCLRVVEGT